MLQLLKLQRNKQAPHKIKWINSEMPAKIFFDIMFKNIPVTVMGTGTPEQLEQAYDKIVDEFVELDGNSAIVEWYKKRARIGRLVAIIELINLILSHICTSFLTTEERLDAIQELNRIEEKPDTTYSKAKMLVNFDINKPFWEEVARVQNVILGQLETELRFLIGAEKKQSADSKYIFEKELVDIENILGRPIDDSVSLKKYTQLRKSAILKVNTQKKNTRHGK